MHIKIKSIKNITSCDFDLPIEKGIFCLAGSNGCGKSTLLSCVAQTVFNSSLLNFHSCDFKPDSFVEFSYNNSVTRWIPINGKWQSEQLDKDRIHFNGMYEGSLFYGTRFDDSIKVDDLVSNGSLKEDDIVDADEYIQRELSFILHGDYSHDPHLKRVRNRKIATSLDLKNIPYFYETGGNLISQYRMSSGECLLISLLHFIYNALIRRSLPIDKPILMLIDEIELALHPVAVSRLIDLLNEIIKEHDTLTVVLTSHSPEVIHKISPHNLYMMETDSSGKVEISSPCYPSYAIRDVYMHEGFDFIILVEDLLAKYVVDTIIKREKLNSSKLINILPVGGWENVLKFQNIVYNTNSFGIGTKIFSILDGDVSGDSRLKPYKKLISTFLPIKSVEKYLLQVFTDHSLRSIKKEINDTFFNVESVDEILAEYTSSGDNNGKALYRLLLSNLEKRSISEESFIKELCEIILRNVNFSSFIRDLTSKLQ